MPEPENGQGDDFKIDRTVYGIVPTGSTAQVEPGDWTWHEPKETGREKGGRKMTRTKDGLSLGPQSLDYLVQGFSGTEASLPKF